MNISAQELDNHYLVNVKAVIMLCSEFIKRYAHQLTKISKTNQSSEQTCTINQNQSKSQNNRNNNRNNCGGGRIINITSGQSLSAKGNEIAYAVTKSSIETLTRTICHDIAKNNITINAVNPGLTDSGWMDDIHKKQFIGRFPMGRYGQPEDAARVVAFLASEKAQWITGQVIHSEGGFIREQY